MGLHAIVGRLMKRGEKIEQETRVGSRTMSRVVVVYIETTLTYFSVSDLLLLLLVSMLPIWGLRVGIITKYLTKILWFKGDLNETFVQEQHQRKNTPFYDLES